MIVRTILAILLFAAVRAGAQAPSWLWAYSGGQTGYEYGYAACRDAFNNSYATGSYTSGTMNFGGPATLINTGLGDAFVVKFRSGGGHTWAVNIGGTGGEVGHGIACDPSGNVFVGGWFSSPVLTIGTHTVANSQSSGTDIFIAKLDSSGQVLWLKAAGGFDNDQLYAIACDPSGNAVITGVFKGTTCTFGPYTLNNGSPGTNDIFMVKVDGSGVFTWAKSFGAAGDDIGRALAIDSNGDIILGGHFSTLNFQIGGTQLSNKGGFDAFVARYSPSGLGLWAVAIADIAGEACYGLSVSSAGDIAVTGAFSSPSLTLGSTQLVNAGSTDIYITKLNSQGVVQWAISAGGTYDDDGYGVCFESGGNLLATGRYTSKDITFGTSLLNNSWEGSNEMYATRLNASTGAEMWAVTAGNSGDEISYAILTGTDAEINLVGTFNSGMVLMGITGLIKGCENDFFIATLSFVTGQEELNGAPELIVYPNPSAGKVQLQGGISTDVLKVYSILGAIQYSGSGIAHDLSALPAGAYLYEIIRQRSQSTETRRRGNLIKN